MTECLAQNNVP